MATVIRDLLVRLGVSADNKAAMNFDRAVQGVKRSLVAAVAAAAALTAGLFTLVRNVANAGDEAAKTARRLGTTAEAVQELGFVADITGTSVGAIETSIRRMSRVVNDADQGLATAQRTMRQLGVNAKNANGETKDSVDLFEEFVGALAGVESQVQRAALAQEVFGRAGTQMLTMIDDQGSSIGDLRREAQDLGLVMSNEAAAASEEFNDSLTRLFTIITGIKNQIGIALMPVLMHVIQRIHGWVRANRDIIQQRIDRVIERIGAAFTKLTDKAKDLDGLIRATIGWETALTTILSAIATLGAMKFAPVILIAIKGVVAIFSLLGLKIIAIIAIFAGVVLVVQDLITHFRGGESVIGDLIERFTTGEGAVAQFIARVKEIVKEVANRLMPVFNQAKDLYREFSRVVIAAGQLIWMAVSWLFSQWKMGAERFFNFLVPLLKFLAPIAQATFQNILTYFTVIFGNLGDILEFFVALFSGEFDGIGEVAQAALDLIKGIFSRTFEGVGEIVGRQVDMMKGMIQRFVDWVAEKAGEAFDKLTGIVNKIPGFSTAANIAGAAANAIAQDPRAQAVQNTALAMTGGQTAITVNGAGDPAAVAEAVAGSQYDIWQRNLRQAQEAFGGGEL